MRNRVLHRIERETQPALRHAILGEEGEVVPCSLLNWAYWLEANRKRIIAQEDLPHGYWISTIFLGLNQQYEPDGPPLWFETMVFEPSDGRPSPLTGKVHQLGNEATCQRYTTLEEARAGHQMIKAKWLGYFERMKEEKTKCQNQNPK